MNPSKSAILLSNASAAQVAREALRRVEDWLATLPDGKRWTGMDWAFAAVVAVLALGSTGFFTATTRILADDPDYFFKRLVASFEVRPIDYIETGAIAPAAGGEAAAGHVEAMPVPILQRARALAPADYEIVMIFRGEVLLATPRELLRARVGSVLPGLGTVLSIDEGANAVRFDNATLTSVR